MPIEYTLSEPLRDFCIDNKILDDVIYNIENFSGHNDVWLETNPNEIYHYTNIDSICTWSDTPQGHSYWSSISNQFEHYEQNYNSLTHKNSIMKQSKFRVGDKVVIASDKGSSHGFKIGTELVIQSLTDGRSKRCLDLGIKVVKFVGKSRSAYEDEIDFVKITSKDLEGKIGKITDEIHGLEGKKSDLERQKNILVKRKIKEMSPEDMKTFIVADELENELKLDPEKALSLAKTLLAKTD